MEHYPTFLYTLIGKIKVKVAQAMHRVYVYFGKPGNSLNLIDLFKGLESFEICSVSFTVLECFSHLINVNLSKLLLVRKLSVIKCQICGSFS